MTAEKNQFATVKKNVTWQKPFIRLLLRLLDPIDAALRLFLNRRDVPLLSVRVRSNGVKGQLGGGKFLHMGEVFSTELFNNSSTQCVSKVLDIGCGCGRNAFSVAPHLNYGNYYGIDIDQVSVRSAERNRRLNELGCNFQHVDVYNAEYNPSSSEGAASYKFPFQSEYFDTVFLVSVFTHMLSNDLRSYLAEINRVLKSDGELVFTTFLLDDEHYFGSMHFPLGNGGARWINPELPEVCVGYSYEFISEVLLDSGLVVTRSPLLSTSRGVAAVGSLTEFSQDIIFAKKSEML